MKRLSPKEEEIMRMFWSKGPMFVRDLLELYNEPKPHYNTVSTLVRLGWKKKVLWDTKFMGIHISTILL